MAFVSNENCDHDVTIDYYLRQSAILTKIRKKVGEKEFDNYCYFAYHLLDPRSDYYDIHLSKESCIELIIEDFPNFDKYVEDELFETLFNFIKKFYRNELTMKMDSIRSNLQKYYKTIGDFEPPSTITNEKDAKLLTAMLGVHEGYGKMITQWQELYNKQLKYVKDIEQKVINKEDLSILELKHINSK